MRITLLLAAVLGLALGVPDHGASAQVVPSDTDHVVSLNGSWRFRLGNAGEKVGFESPEYIEDGAWHDLAVPGNWEMAGFSPATYNQPDEAWGMYRKWIDIPAEWKGRIIKVHFDGVQNGAEVFLNGKPVNVDEPSWGKANYHESGWTAFDADLTPAVQPGKQNLLAIRVTKKTKSADLDTGDYFFLGGIHRPVTLYSVPSTQIVNFAFRTELIDGNHKAIAKLIIQTAGDAPVSVAAKLEGLPEEMHQQASAGNGTIELTQTIENPRLWSAELPNLYTLNIDLKENAGGKTIEHVSRRVGIREISTAGGIFKVNGVPVKLQGICRHDVYPTLGTAINDEIWRKDITMMKAANINAIRTSHYPYVSGFYDLCDELGMYVADELPYCWCNTNDAELKAAFEQRARETVRRDLNHPCVVLWAIGNENKEGPNNLAASKVCQQLDPTRPRLSSCHNAEEADTSFDDSHYTEPNVMAAEERKTSRRAKYPRIYLESPNSWENMLGADYGALDIWELVYQRTWDEIWDAPHTTGCFLWEWTDRAVADKATTKPYHYEAATGVQYLKTKGIVDGYRNPRPQYFHVKMTLAPIKLADVSVEDSKATLRATNRYSFTDLSLLTTQWQLLANGKPIGSGSAHPALAPLTKGEIALDLSGSSIEKADALRIDFVHPDGRNVGTYQFQLKPPAPTTPTLISPASVLFPRLNLITTREVPDNIGWHSAVRTRFTLANIQVQKSAGGTSETVEPSDLLKMPLKDIHSMDADIVTGDDPKPFGAVHVDIADGQFAYRIEWKRADNSGQFRGNKRPPAARSAEHPFDVQEIGWAFVQPSQFDHFTWDRKALWTWYPDTHIGRPHGTATPDSSRVNNTRLDRPDAFDFNSTKYDCNYVTLTDTSGGGIGAVFSPNGRHQCKASTSETGETELIVNLHVNPPRDISANAVSDQFLTLTRNSKVNGSFRIGAIAVAGRAAP